MMKKTTAFALLATFLIGGCTNNETAIDSSKLHLSADASPFDLFGYYSTSDGYYNLDGTRVKLDESHLTLDDFKRYKEAGMNTFLCQFESFYWGEEKNQDYETSNLKKCLDLCQEAGIEHCYVLDYRFIHLTELETPIYSEAPGDFLANRQFVDQKALDEYVTMCMKDYSSHPAFAGVILRDEPKYSMLERCAEVYRSIKRVCPKAEPFLNLFPLYATQASLTDDPLHETREESYRKYLEKFVTLAKPDTLSVDSYPFRESTTSYRMEEHHMAGIQIFMDVCRKYSIEPTCVASSAQMYKGGMPDIVKPQSPDMQWQVNFYMGMGVKRIGYYTYWPSPHNAKDGEFYPDGTSFVDTYGKPTYLYYDMQTIHEEMQNLSSVIRKFSYQTSTTLLFPPSAYSTSYLNMENANFELVNEKDVHANEGSALFLSELKDDSGNHLYALMNAANPCYERTGQANLSTDISIRFENCDAALVYYRGKSRYQKLQNGVYSTHLEAGFADYIIPFQSDE